ncbi:hypothetical protein F4604DRAFT_955492 [Suillus subluteus]|nr:hypothetical protein F4604DRAFT_955492 [Suillus subluteus]
MPAELEQTLVLLSSHCSVPGYLLLSRRDHVSIIRHSGLVFEGEQGKKYASVMGKMVESVQAGSEEVNVLGQDSLRTKRHEIMILPHARYLLTVLYRQDLLVNAGCRNRYNYSPLSALR